MKSKLKKNCIFLYNDKLTNEPLGRFFSVFLFPLKYEYTRNREWQEYELKRKFRNLRENHYLLG